MICGPFPRFFPRFFSALMPPHTTTTHHPSPTYPFAPHAPCDLLYLVPHAYRTLISMLAI